MTAVNTTGAVPTLDVDTIALDKGQSKTINLHLKDDSPAAGEYQGFVEITGTKATVSTRVPYWLGVRGTTAKYVAVLQPVDNTYRSFGDQVPFLFRVLDGTELPFDPGDVPTITSTAPRAGVVSIAAAGTIPGTYSATLRVGRADTDGLNVFTIHVGDTTRDVVFVIR